MSSRRLSVLCLPLLLLTASSTWGAQERKQSSFAAVDVRDESGAPVPNAVVRFTSLSTGQKTSGTADAMGRLMVELPPGDYDVTPMVLGFRRMVQRIKVKCGEKQSFAFVLRVQTCPPGPCLVVTAAPPDRVLQNLSGQKGVTIRSVKLFAWRGNGKERKYSEVQGFQESQKPHRLLPSAKFDVMCEVAGQPNLDAGDYFLWTAIDFVVAPVKLAYERMDNKELGSSATWGQVTEMRDLKAVPIYSLLPGESRRIFVKGFDLTGTLAAFSGDDTGELWPWLIRVTIHIQDRSGNNIAVAEQTLRLSPVNARKTSHYNDPIPRELP